MSSAAFRELFPVTRNLIYFNHAAVGPLSVRAYEAMERFARDQRDHGALHWKKWYAEYDRARESAAKLIGAHADEIGGLAGENLRKMRDWLPKARLLLTIKRDVPLSVSIHDLQLSGNPAKQRELYERFGFKTWLRELDPALDPPTLLATMHYANDADLQHLREGLAKAGFQ